MYLHVYTIHMYIYCIYCIYIYILTPAPPARMPDMPVTIWKLGDSFKMLPLAIIPKRMVTAWRSQSTRNPPEINLGRRACERKRSKSRHVGFDMMWLNATKKADRFVNIKGKEVELITSLQLRVLTWMTVVWHCDCILGCDWFLGTFSKPIGSMGLVYLPTFTINIYIYSTVYIHKSTIHVGKYIPFPWILWVLQDFKLMLHWSLDDLCESAEVGNKNMALSILATLASRSTPCSRRFVLSGWAMVWWRTIA